MTTQGAPESIDIRPVTAFDLALLGELHAAIFRAPWDQPWSAWSRDVIGFILDEGEILLTGIAPAARRRGHAARLMRVLIESARTAGLRTLFLEHAAGNEAAGALYGGFGFSRIGRRRAYYERRGGGREDAITLRCDLAEVRIPHQGGPLE